MKRSIIFAAMTTTLCAKAGAEGSDTGSAAPATNAPKAAPKDAPSIADMLAIAKQVQEQQAAFAAQAASVRKQLQDAIADLDKKKAEFDGPYKDAIAGLEAAKKELTDEYNANVKDLLLQRQEKAAQLQQLVAAGLGKAATPTTTTPVSAGNATRNKGVKEFVFGLLDSDPAMSPAQLAQACAEHYGNDSTTAGTCNGIKVLWNKQQAGA
jgi:DNA repair ATPase RecN